MGFIGKIIAKATEGGFYTAALPQTSGLVLKKLKTCEACDVSDTLDGFAACPQSFVGALAHLLFCPFLFFQAALDCHARMR